VSPTPNSDKGVLCDLTVRLVSTLSEWSIAGA